MARHGHNHPSWTRLIEAYQSWQLIRSSQVVPLRVAISGSPAIFFRGSRQAIPGRSHQTLGRNQADACLAVATGVTVHVEKESGRGIIGAMLIVLNFLFPGAELGNRHFCEGGGSQRIFD